MTLKSLIDSGDLGADVARYRSLANTPYPECPITLPSSGKTPTAALADYLKFWDTPADSTGADDKAEATSKADGIIARCDAMRRDISDAIDNNELDRASGLVGQFESACSRKNQTYADLTRLYKQRLAEASAAQQTVALPRRGGNSGSELFQKAITQAEQEERERPMREAREREASAREVRERPMREARAAEQERLASIKAGADARAYEEAQARKSEQDARETAEAMGQLLGVIGQIQKNKADHEQATNWDKCTATFQDENGKCIGAIECCIKVFGNLNKRGRPWR